MAWTPITTRVPFDEFFAKLDKERDEMRRLTELVARDIDALELSDQDQGALMLCLKRCTPSQSDLVRAAVRTSEHDARVAEEESARRGKAIDEALSATTIEGVRRALSDYMMPF